MFGRDRGRPKCFEYLERLELIDALDLAARAAALNCSALGGMGRLMTRDEAGLGDRSDPT